MMCLFVFARWIEVPVMVICCNSGFVMCYNAEFILIFILLFV